MNLLDPNEIKEEKKGNAIASQKLITALAEEEAKLNKALNLVKENAKIEREKIEAETTEFVESQKTIKSDLIKEVTGLEARRAEALKPVKDVTAEANTTLEEAKTALSRALTKEKEAEALHEENLDLADTLKDRKEELDERERKVKSKEDIAVTEDRRLKDSANTLADKWVQFHTTVTTTNSNFENKDKRIADAEKVLDIRKKTLDERDAFQTQHVKQIRDKYATLGRAIEEAKKKYNVNI